MHVCELSMSAALQLMESKWWWSVGGWGHQPTGFSGRGGSGSLGHTACYCVGFWGWWLWNVYRISWEAFAFSKQSLLPKRNSLMEWFQHRTQKMLPKQKLNYFHSFNELCHLQWCFPRESPPCIMAFIEYYILWGALKSCVITIIFSSVSLMFV